MRAAEERLLRARSLEHLEVGERDHPSREGKRSGEEASIVWSRSSKQGSLDLCTSGWGAMVWGDGQSKWGMRGMTGNEEPSGRCGYRAKAREQWLGEGGRGLRWVSQVGLGLGIVGKEPVERIGYSAGHSCAGWRAKQVSCSLILTL